MTTSICRISSLRDILTFIDLNFEKEEKINLLEELKQNLDKLIILDDRPLNPIDCKLYRNFNTYIMLTFYPEYFRKKISTHYIKESDSRLVEDLKKKIFNQQGIYSKKLSDLTHEYKCINKNIRLLKNHRGRIEDDLKRKLREKLDAKNTKFNNFLNVNFGKIYAAGIFHCGIDKSTIRIQLFQDVTFEDGNL